MTCLKIRAWRKGIEMSEIPCNTLIYIVIHCNTRLWRYFPSYVYTQTSFPFHRVLLRIYFRGFQMERVAMVTKWGGNRAANDTDETWNWTCSIGPQKNCVVSCSLCHCLGHRTWGPKCLGGLQVPTRTLAHRGLGNAEASPRSATGGSYDSSYESRWWFSMVKVGFKWWDFWNHLPLFWLRHNGLGWAIELGVLVQLHLWRRHLNIGVVWHGKFSIFSHSSVVFSNTEPKGWVSLAIFGHLRTITGPDAGMGLLGTIPWIRRFRQMTGRFGGAPNGNTEPCKNCQDDLSLGVLKFDAEKQMLFWILGKQREQDQCRLDQYTSYMTWDNLQVKSRISSDGCATGWQEGLQEPAGGFP